MRWKAGNLPDWLREMQLSTQGTWRAAACLGQSGRMPPRAPLSTPAWPVQQAAPDGASGLQASWSISAGRAEGTCGMAGRRPSEREPTPASCLTSCLRGLWTPTLCSQHLVGPLRMRPTCPVGAGHLHRVQPSVPPTSCSSCM